MLMFLILLAVKLCCNVALNGTLAFHIKSFVFMELSGETLSSTYVLPGCSWPVDSIVEVNKTQYQKCNYSCSHTEHDCEIAVKTAMFP